MMLVAVCNLYLFLFLRGSLGIDEFVETKIGSCPPTLIDPDDETCESNLDCPGHRLCCYGEGKTSKCSDPLESKGYSCPSKDVVDKGSTSCLLDSQCPDDEKCCPNNQDSFSCIPPDKKDLEINFRQSCKVIIPSDAKCPSPPIQSTTSLPCNGHPDCATNGNERMCCPDGSGGRVCAEPFSSKAGKCPPAEKMVVDSGGSFCMVDSNCPDAMKCCVSPMGCPICTQPNITSGQPTCFAIEKQGGCPALPINEGRESCNSDTQCPGNRLCCQRSYSTDKRCSDPYTPLKGTCPTPSNVLMNQLQCAVDDNCLNGMKCCPVTNCSYYCAQAVGGGGGKADPYYCGTGDKIGTCPLTPINPTLSCRSQYQCPGRQLCCKNKCSDPETTKIGSCPVASQVSRGPSNCLMDSACTLPNRKCCPDVNCQYYCTYSV